MGDSTNTNSNIEKTDITNGSCLSCLFFFLSYSRSFSVIMFEYFFIPNCFSLLNRINKTNHRKIEKNRQAEVMYKYITVFVSCLCVLLFQLTFVQLLRVALLFVDSCFLPLRNKKKSNKKKKQVEYSLVEYFTNESLCNRARRYTAAPTPRRALFSFQRGVMGSTRIRSHPSLRGRAHEA